jgi:allophanate hydrolase
VAERLHATQPLLDADPDAILPVTRAIFEKGRHYSALDAYRAQYELARLKRAADLIFGSIDVLLLPTTGTIYETAAVDADPFRLNANLGLYTNFVNLLDLTAIAVPAGFRKNGLPFGISLIAPAFAEHALLDLTIRLRRWD